MTTLTTTLLQTAVTACHIAQAGLTRAAYWCAVGASQCAIWQAEQTVSAAKDAGEHAIHRAALDSLARMTAAHAQLVTHKP